MFLASLNLDLFFKKVFSEKDLAKHFLEDLLGETISSIDYLDIENKISDDAVTIKFDFRCKIRGRYVVIEMQQTYKTDVIKRFYMYNAVSTALQLETLKPVTIEKANGEKYTEKNYSTLEPVLTLIWMVDDSLGFKEDFVAFTTLPEAAKDFITDKILWEQPFENILAERKKVLNILENDTKGLNFLTENKTIYLFQKNIVKNKRVNLPYYKWFDFAAKSKNINNKEKDFEQYKKDKDMAEVIKRLRKDKLSTQEADYVTAFLSFEVAMEQLRREKAADRKQMSKIEGDIRKAQQIIAEEQQEKLKERQERIKAEDERIKERDERIKERDERIKERDERIKTEGEKKLLQLKMVKILLQQGCSLNEMAETLGTSVEETSELVEKVQDQK